MEAARRASRGPFRRGAGRGRGSARRAPPKGGGRDDGRHRLEFSRLRVRTRATEWRGDDDDVQLAPASAGQPVIESTEARGIAHCADRLELRRVGSISAVATSSRRRNPPRRRSPRASRQRRARAAVEGRGGGAWPRADARRHGGPGPVPRARAGARARVIGGCHQEGVPQKALVLHPDKRAASEREKAQREFDQLQKAYDILLDPEARAALENLAKARGEPREGRAADAATKASRGSRGARARGGTRQERGGGGQRAPPAELARLRRDFATRKRATTARPPPPPPPRTRPRGSAPPTPRPPCRSISPNLKVAWRRDASNYPARRLRDIYAQFGTVEDVVIREGKKKKEARWWYSRNAPRREPPRRRRATPNPLLAVPAAVPPPGWTTPERGAGEKSESKEKIPRGLRRGHLRGRRRGVVYSRAASPGAGVCFPAGPRREAPGGVSWVRRERGESGLRERGVGSTRRARRRRVS